MTTAVKASGGSSADLEILLELDRNYVRSALESDVRWYSENLSEDFYITAPDGALLDRAAFLDRIANPYASPRISCGFRHRHRAKSWL